MTEENGPHRRDGEAFSTHARTAVAFRYQAGPQLSGGCQKTVIKTYRADRSRSSARKRHGLARLPKKSLTLEKNPTDSGWVAPEDNFSNSDSNSCCFLVRFCGVSTTTCTYRSPVWRERSTGMPFDAMRNRRLDCVPAGIFTRVLPLSMVGTSNSPPSAAVTIEIGTRQCRSAPSRWKNSCAASERKM